MVTYSVYSGTIMTQTRPASVGGLCLPWTWTYILKPKRYYKLTFHQNFVICFVYKSFVHIHKSSLFYNNCCLCSFNVNVTWPQLFIKFTGYSNDLYFCRNLKTNILKKVIQKNYVYVLNSILHK